MKKAIVFILAAMLLVIFASCGSSEKSGVAEGESTEISTTTTKPAATSTTTTKPATTTTTVPATETTTETTTEGKPARSGVPFEFTTTDVNGNSVSLADYSYAKVIMINMWVVG